VILAADFSAKRGYDFATAFEVGSSRNADIRAKRTACGGRVRETEELRERQMVPQTIEERRKEEREQDYK